MDLFTRIYMYITFKLNWRFAFLLLIFPSLYLICFAFAHSLGIFFFCVYVFFVFLMLCIVYNIKYLYRLLDALASCFLFRFLSLPLFINATIFTLFYTQISVFFYILVSFKFQFCFVFVLRLKFKHNQILYLLLRFAFLNVLHDLLVFFLFLFLIFYIYFRI